MIFFFLPPNWKLLCSSEAISSGFNSCTNWNNISQLIAWFHSSIHFFKERYAHLHNNVNTLWDENSKEMRTCLYFIWHFYENICCRNPFYLERIQLLPTSVLLCMAVIEVSDQLAFNQHGCSIVDVFLYCLKTHYDKVRFSLSSVTLLFLEIMLYWSCELNVDLIFISIVINKDSSVYM